MEENNGIGLWGLNSTNYDLLTAVEIYDILIMEGIPMEQFKYV